MGYSASLFTEIKDRGEPRISELIDLAVPEDNEMDYKRSESNGAGATLSPADLRTFANSVCALANTDGGLIIWGVDCRWDS